MIRPAASAAPFAVACVAIALFSGMDAIMKGQAIALGAWSALAWRALIGTIGTGVAFAARRGRWPRGRVLGIHVVRSLATTFSVLLFFWGLVRTPMAEGVALTFLAPLLATFLAALTLGERIRRGAVIGSVLAFAGVLVIVAGRAGGPHGPDAVVGAGAIILASLLYAISLVMLRYQAQGATPIEITFVTNVVMLLGLLPAAPWLLTMPSAAGLGWLALAAALAAASSLLLAWAYARGQMQSLSTVEYTAFVWAAMFGALIFGEAVTAATVAGAAMIVGGCLVAARGRAGDAVAGTEAAA